MGSKVDLLSKTLFKDWCWLHKMNVRVLRWHQSHTQWELGLLSCPFGGSGPETTAARAPISKVLCLSHFKGSLFRKTGKCFNCTPGWQAFSMSEATQHQLLSRQTGTRETFKFYFPRANEEKEKSRRKNKSPLSTHFFFISCSGSIWAPHGTLLRAGLPGKHSSFMRCSLVPYASPRTLSKSWNPDLCWKAARMLLPTRGRVSGPHWAGFLFVHGHVFYPEDSKPVLELGKSVGWFPSPLHYLPVKQAQVGCEVLEVLWFFSMM